MVEHRRHVATAHWKEKKKGTGNLHTKKQKKNGKVRGAAPPHTRSHRTSSTPKIDCTFSEHTYINTTLHTTLGVL